MPRTKPTTKIDTIGNLDLNPEEVIGDFIESKQQGAFFTNPPNWDSAGDSIEQLYIQGERDHTAMLRLQDEMLQNSKCETAINIKRISELYKKQMNLRKRVIEVNSFIKECEDKKQIAQKKVSEQTALHEGLQKNIDKDKRSISELNEFREVLESTVKELEPYEAVIEDVVVEKPEIFDSVKDCMDRCNALMLAQVEISGLEQKKLQEIDEMRQHMVQVTNDAALIVLGLKNDLTNLERSYNQAHSDCLRWERIMASAKDCVAQNELNKERTLDGVRDIYQMLCRRRKCEPVYQRWEVEKELDFVKDEVELLLEVVKELEKTRHKTTDGYHDGKLKDV